MNSVLPTLRLLQIADSSFPVGGFAYSHGLEWLASQQRPSEADLAALLAGYLEQVGGGQWLPAALAARRAGSLAPLLHGDEALDASIAAMGEREAGRAMGERLLAGAADAFPSVAAGRTQAMLAAVRGGETPGQYAVAFGAVANDHEVGEPEMLAALSFAMASSITQAAVRLNLIGQGAAGRLIAGAAPRIDRLVAATIARKRGLRLGAFTPALDVAALLQPSLKFRMFAS